MPFELHDFQELVRSLQDHPEWREELRALLLTQELLTLPALAQQLTETVARLAEGQERLTASMDQLTARMDQLTARVDQLTQRMDQLTQRMDQLTEGQQRLTQRMDQLTQHVDQLTQRMDQLTQRMDQLTQRMDQLTETVSRLIEGQERLTERVDQLTESQQRLAEGQQRLEIQMGEVRGWSLEQRYRTHAPAYFGRLLRQVQPADIGRLAESLRERLEEQELAEVLLADLILTGRSPTPPGPSEIWVVLEVSATVDRSDVERAQRRAALLRQARYPTVAVAGGREVTAGARQAAGEGGVALLLDGRIDGWREAFDHMLAEEEAGSP
jgi:outer membrane murein-binding lipoprotein Lpp